MIEVKHIVKRYQFKKVISDLNMTLPDSGLIAIVGPSGCGKTTLLHIIGGIDNDYYGEVKYNGKSIKKSKIKKNIGFLFQNFHLISWLKGNENVHLPLYYRFFKYPSYDYDLNIQKCLSQEIYELSLGQRQRLAFLRSMIYYPKVLLCDEPTSSLDKNNSRIIMELLKKESKNRLVVFVSHDKELVEKYSDEIYEMKDGEIINHSINNHVDNKNEVLYQRGMKYPIFKLSWLSMIQNKLRVFQLIIAVVLSLSSVLLSLSLSEGFRNQLHLYIDSIVPQSSISFRLKDHSSIDTCPFQNEVFVKYLYQYTDEFELLGITEVREKYSIGYNIPLFDDSGFIKKTELLYGKMTEKEDEIVISKSTALHLKQSSDIKSLINKKVKIWYKYKNEVKGKIMTISGISRDDSNDTIYYYPQANFSIIKEIFNQNDIKSTYGIVYTDNVEKDIEYLKKQYKEYEFKQVGKSTRDKIDDFMDKAKIVILLFTSFVVVSSVFLIGQSMFLEVVLKRKEIAIMKCFGAKHCDIFSFVLYQGIIIYIIGIIISYPLYSVSGFLINIFLKDQLLFQMNFISNDIYQISKVYILGFLFIISSIIIPAIYAIKTNVSDSLKRNS